MRRRDRRRSRRRAFERAYEGDPVSAFGGIVALNRPVDRATAERMCQPGRFLEAILAPGFDEEALRVADDQADLAEQRPAASTSMAPIGPDDPPPPGATSAGSRGACSSRTGTGSRPTRPSGSVPTRRSPTDAERRDLAFAWRVCAAVKSNAIVLARDGQIVGVGAGQMSRLDSVRIAVEKAGPRARGSVLASDAFFPFRDGPDLRPPPASTAIIQPGGSRRDDETIQACDEHDIADDPDRPSSLPALIAEPLAVARADPPIDDLPIMIGGPVDSNLPDSASDPESPERAESSSSEHRPKLDDSAPTGAAQIPSLTASQRCPPPPPHAASVSAASHATAMEAAHSAHSPAAEASAEATTHR